MKLNKAKFLKSALGSELKSMITVWDQTLNKDRPAEDYKGNLKVLEWCQAQWEVYRIAIRHCYGMKCHFIRTDEYFGICTEDESDWLMKLDREPVSQGASVPGSCFDDSNYADTGSRMKGINRHMGPKAYIHEKRKFVSQGNPYLPLCKKLERKFKRDTGTFPVE